MHRNWLRIEEYQEIDSPEIDTDEFRPIVLSEDYPDIETQWQVALNYLQPFVVYRSGQNDTHITQNRGGSPRLQPWEESDKARNNHKR